MDEVSFALEERKIVIPVIYRNCTVPFRLRRVQHVDFRQDYARGLQVLLKILAPGQSAEQSKSAIADVGRQSQSDVADADQRQRAAERARLEDERPKTAELTRLDRERKLAAKRARVEQERMRAAEGVRLEDEGQQSAEEAEHTRPESEQAEHEIQKKLSNTDRIRTWSYGKRNVIGTLALILVLAFCLGIVDHYLFRVPHNPGTATPATEQWNSRASGTPNDLRSIFKTTNGERLWAVGYRGTILESDDGEHWNACTGGTALDPATRTFVVASDLTIVAIGQKCTLTAGDVITRTTDTPDADQTVKASVAASKRSDCARGQTVTVKVDDLQEMQNHFDGQLTNGLRELAKKQGTGDIPRARDTRRNDLSSIFGTSDGKRLWAVGSEGTILESDDGRGEHWSPLNSGTHNWLHSIFGTSNGERLWTVGGGGTILESDDGEHWKARNSGNQSRLSNIFGTSDGKRLWAVGENGTILESDDGGENWSPRTSGTPHYLYSIFGTSNGKRLWAAGGNGTILESDDGGEHWNPLTSGTQHHLFSIFGTSDGKRLWAVGYGGTILGSDDGGEHWDPRNSGTQNNLEWVSGTSDGRRLWAVGDKGTILEASLP